MNKILTILLATLLLTSCGRNEITRAAESPTKSPDTPPKTGTSKPRKPVVLPADIGLDTLTLNGDWTYTGLVEGGPCDAMQYGGEFSNKVKANSSFLNGTFIDIDGSNVKNKTCDLYIFDNIIAGNIVEEKKYSLVQFITALQLLTVKNEAIREFSVLTFNTNLVVIEFDYVDSTAITINLIKGS